MDTKGYLLIVCSLSWGFSYGMDHTKQTVELQSISDSASILGISELKRCTGILFRENAELSRYFGRKFANIERKQQRIVQCSDEQQVPVLPRWYIYLSHQLSNISADELEQNCQTRERIMSAIQNLLMNEK